MKIYFIVHGSDKIGMGHIMRSLSLASVFKVQGHEVLFFSKYEQGIQQIKTREIAVCTISSESSQDEKSGFFYGRIEELELEIAEIRKYMDGKADVIIIDSYNVTEAYFAEIRKLTNCLVYIDDLNSFTYPVDILINGTASAFDMKYEKSQKAYLLLGMKYIQIREEFYNIPQRKMSANIQDVLITTGSSDPYHITENLLNILMKIESFSTFRYHVIVGSGFEDKIKLNDLATDNRHIFLYDRPKNMAEIMLRCDFAIAAGGSTLYELMICGVPAVTFAYADNQIPHIKALERKGLLKYVGCYNHLDEAQLIRYIKYLMGNLNVRENLVKRLQLMADGNGCTRIVEEINNYIKRIIAFRS